MNAVDAVSRVVNRLRSGMWTGVCVGLVLGVALAAVAVRGHADTTAPATPRPPHVVVTATTIGRR
jgi:hypothetical protein